jgi:hypothetical protein
METRRHQDSIGGGKHQVSRFFFFATEILINVTGNIFFSTRASHIGRSPGVLLRYTCGSGGTERRYTNDKKDLFVLIDVVAFHRFVSLKKYG